MDSPQADVTDSPNNPDYNETPLTLKGFIKYTRSDLYKETIYDAIKPHLSAHNAQLAQLRHEIDRLTSMTMVTIPVANLQGHLWSNVCSKFHENRGILKHISRNRDMGVFFT